MLLILQELYFYNIGEGSNRDWEDYIKYGFISAGQREIFRKSMLEFSPGDVFVAYKSGKGKGFVGVGRITHKAEMIKNIEINGVKLLDKKLKCKKMGVNSDSVEKSEYVALVEWIKKVPRSKAKWKSNIGLFTPRPIRATLEGQIKTIEYINKNFALDLEELVK